MSEIIVIPNPETVPEPPQSAPPEPSKWRKIVDWRPGPRGRLWFAGAAIFFGAIFLVLSIFYFRLAHTADRRLRNGVFAASVNIYAAPRIVAVGDRISEAELLNWLRQNGYNTASGNRAGWYQVRPNAIAIFPGEGTDSSPDPAIISFSGRQLTRIQSGGAERKEYQFAPALITNLSDRNREKRRLVRFSEIPSSLVNAIVSTEDKHFFSHGGFDLLRIFKAAYIDLKDGRKEQGASTLSMQLARGIWLEPEKKWKRKLAELLLTMHLEQKLSKREIFTDYANQVYLGRRGTFSINGFGEAAHVYFDKDITQLTLPEAALLAGMVQRPSYYNPYRYPDRAMERRNMVLRLMLDDRHLTSDQYTAAVAAPLKLSAGGMDVMDSQYFLDLANDELQNRLGDREAGSESVFTTLDEDLQRAAVEAVRIGMAKVDAQLHRARGPALPHGQPQVALIALDPHTGEIKALVGGRDYGASQLNHVTAERQPGSVFKPFVYAAALNTAVTGGAHQFTTASTLEDAPTTFQAPGGQTYSPGNFGHDFMGTVTLRTALAHSLNVATVSLAQAVGYRAVVALARRAGLNDGIQPTPAVALGSYVCTPMEIAAAYTMFANGGMYVKPTMLAGVRSHEGDVLYQHSPETRPVLDARVNYLMVSLMQEVLRTGTGASVWSLGFNAPAAGKTGTSRDGWFAGFTTRLLCIVWVGFDDNRDLNLEGAKSALPIWAEFMKRALDYNRYRDAHEFPVPSGIVSAKLCPDSHQLAGPECPTSYTEFFLDGTEPTTRCQMHSVSASVASAGGGQ